jgi:hypothetical protein
MKRKPETDQDLINSIAQLLEQEDPDESPELVDDELRAAGFDPEEIGAKIARIAEEAHRRSPLNWRQRARAERTEAERRLARRSDITRLRSRDEIVREINAVVARSPRLQGAPTVQAHFRNFETATNEDLADLLVELEFLEGETSAERE